MIILILGGAVSRFLVPILLVIFAAWSYYATDWYVCYVKKECVTPQPVVRAAPVQVEPDPAPIVEEVEKAEVLEDESFEIVDQKILFKTGATSPQASMIIVNYVKELSEKFLKASSEGSVLEVSGHTDNVGDPMFNKDLSQKRAQAIADLFISNKVPKNKIRAIGYGQERPLNTNSTPDERRLNRRVEIKF